LKIKTHLSGSWSASFYLRMPWNPEPDQFAEASRASVAHISLVAAGVSPAVEGGILPPGKTGRPKTPYRAQGFSVR